MRTLTRLIVLLACAPAALGAQQTFHITPLRPIEELRAEALAATPPAQPDSLRKPNLVELVTLDPLIHLDIRYATDGNFMGSRMYNQARAFAQRPAALALVRAGRKLQELGYGLLIHDAYRPWYVTKMFWEATPESLRTFVANPATGSKHNRGCAIDLSLYDLKTGRPVQFPSGYDEFSERAYSDYAGGTAIQNKHRALLRQAMEGQGFVVNPTEWWHFDFKDWQKYPVMNVKFEDLAVPSYRPTRSPR